jgi:hypothetical protein
MLAIREPLDCLSKHDRTDITRPNHLERYLVKRPRRRSQHDRHVHEYELCESRGVALLAARRWPSGEKTTDRFVAGIQKIPYVMSHMYAPQSVPFGETQQMKNRQVCP